MIIDFHTHTFPDQIAASAIARLSNNAHIEAHSNGTAGGLLLAGHTDTVPFDDGRWTRDPFTLTEHDNKLYGLGTADMKGFFAFILDALRDVDVTKLKKPLYILATADEETSMAGARYFSENTSIRPDCAIIGGCREVGSPMIAQSGRIDVFSEK